MPDMVKVWDHLAKARWAQDTKGREMSKADLLQLTSLLYEDVLQAIRAGQEVSYERNALQEKLEKITTIIQGQE